MNFEDVFSYEHLFRSGLECCKSVRWKQSTQTFEMNMAINIAKIHEQLMDGTYKSKGFHNFTIVERGKKRNIKSVHISERCVQKCLSTYYLKPLLEKKLIYDNGASLKGKGTEFAIKRMTQHLTNHYKKYGMEGGILLQDYHDYFASIDREKLKAMLDRDIDDERIKKLTFMFIDNMGKDRGLGLGSEVYQIMAIYYPNQIDHYVKEHLHIEHYGRYMDDSYMIHPDIEYLKYCKDIFATKSKELGLQMNEKNTRIVRFKDQFTYLKKRVNVTNSGKVLKRLSRKNITTRRRTLKRMTNKHIDTAHSFQSWKGYARHYDSYNTIISMEKLYTELLNSKEV